MPTLLQPRSDRHPHGSAPAEETSPYLEYMADLSSGLHRIVLADLPFCLGRTDAAHFVIACSQISRRHAEVYQEDGTFRVRDLGSTNGTYVNGRRILDAVLKNGDIVHLAHREFRFVAQADALPDYTPPLTDYVNGKLPLSILHGRPLLEEMLRHRFVCALFQPVLDLNTRQVLGYEALGRGTHGELSTKPYDLLCLAQRCGLARHLSGLFRTVAIAEAGRLPGRPAVFCNLHPSEVENPQYLDSLCLFEALSELKKCMPAGQELVVEVHEDTASDLSTLQRLRQQLDQLGIGLAYDDFGAGQSRLAELAEAPPDFLKLDMELIRDIHRAPSRQHVLRSITRAAHDLGIQIIAEGIETADEAKVCRDLGCQYGQGYLFGRPQAAPLAGEAPDTWEIDLDSYTGTIRVPVLADGVDSQSDEGRAAGVRFDLTGRAL